MTIFLGTSKYVPRGVHTSLNIVIVMYVQAPSACVAHASSRLYTGTTASVLETNIHDYWHHHRHVHVLGAKVFLTDPSALLNSSLLQL